MRCDHYSDFFRIKEAFGKHNKLCRHKPQKIICTFCNESFYIEGSTHFEHFNSCYQNQNQNQVPRGDGNQNSKNSVARTPRAARITASEDSTHQAASPAQDTTGPSPLPLPPGTKSCDHYKGLYTSDINKHFGVCLRKRNKLAHQTDSMNTQERI